MCVHKHHNPFFLSHTLSLSSPIFCHGPLLAAIQNASIFNDSKEFVDRPLIASPATILAAFENLPDQNNVTLLREFVYNWTLEAGTDLEKWEPTDWVPRSTNDHTFDI